MKRRTFAQMLALAAGSLGLAPGEAAEEENEAAAGPRMLTGPEPVNVEDFRKLSRSILPKATYEYIDTGSADEVTLRENVDAFQRIKILPPLMRGVTQTDTSTTVFGKRVSMPLLLAPVAGLRMFHPEGALAAARAAAAANIVAGVSSSAGNSVEEIARASKGPKWFQLYVPSDRAVAKRLVRRIEEAGYDALIVTVDLGEWKDADRRNRFSVPKEMLVKHLRDIGYDQVTLGMSYQEVLDFNLKAWNISLSWDFFAWLRSVTKLPLLIKGVLRRDDARKAVEIGLDGIVVSNHGGRRLDGMPATIERLPEIVDAVDGKTEIYMDGGVRRGTDVLKALAYGARAVLVGRPYAWALSAGGEEGVSKVIDLFRAEFENAMTATGCARVADINRNLIE